MKVNVLGTEYEIIESSKSEYPKLEDLNGYCELHSKRIIIDDLVEKSADRLACENLDIFKKKVIRHELLHAFLYESGICISDVTPINEEELVEWIAVQFPKILNVFKSISVDTDDPAIKIVESGAEIRGDEVDEDAKLASIPYTYNAPQHDWKCGYPTIKRGDEK